MICLKFTGIALAVCFSLSACGGGGSSSQPDAVQSATSAPPAAIEAKPACRDVRVLLLGDSVMDGSHKYTLDTEGRSALARYFDANSTRHVVIINGSAPGTTSTQLIAGWDGVKQGQAWPYKPDADFIIINHGLNDAARVTGNDYQGNLRIVATAGLPVVFQTPNPTTDPAQNTKGYAEIMRTVALESNMPVADAYAYVMAQPEWAKLIADGAHPTHQLYLNLAAQVVGPAALPLVEAAPCQ